MTKLKTIEMPLEYQNYIQEAPMPSDALYKTACGNDEATLNAWRDVWLKNIRENHKALGPFKDRGLGQLWGTYRYMPAIVAGAGPSLKRNGTDLKDRGEIPLISCLHNFHFFEDRDIKVDFYVTLDAGEVTIEEVSEGGAKTEEEYWSATEKHTLLAYIGTSPRLLAKWRGKILFFNCPTPALGIDEEIEKIEKFHTFISPGGNVLGACLYIAKAIMGANPIAFVGADFSFSYDKKFHAWDSKYDKSMGQVVRTVDVFGHKVYTWASYHGFKCFFDWVTQRVPGSYYNCSEGGTFGAYPEGNIMSVRQVDLAEFLRMYHLCFETKDLCERPDEAQKAILY